MSSEAGRPLTGDELRWWLNDRHGKTVTLSIELEGVIGPTLTAKGELGHSSDDFEPVWVSANADLAGSSYTVGPIVLNVADPDSLDVELVTATEHEAEMVEVRIAPTVVLTIGDPL